jgi:FlaA1/EpsC-like NDP-sugar epimerase
MRVILKDWQKGIAIRLGPLVADTAVMAAAYLVAFLLRFDFYEPSWGWDSVAFSFIVVWAVQMCALAVFGCDRPLWRFFSIGDVPRFVGAIFSATLVLVGLRLLFPEYRWMRPPYSITFFNCFLVTGGLLGIRLFARLVGSGGFEWQSLLRERGRRVLLVGAGVAGDFAARELKRTEGRLPQIVGFLDDDLAKRNALVQGISVIGTINELPAVVRRLAVDEVIVAMVKVPREVVRHVVQLCEKAHVPVRILPGYGELISGKVTASQIRKVDVADLLGRAETTIDAKAIAAILGRKRVLITGAGGSIGSELVRQVACIGPESLLLVERNERALYEIDREMREKGMQVSVVPLLADIGDDKRMEEIFAKYKPQVVVHAAAHKHVPMMELNPGEALKNNTLATRRLGELCVKTGVERFVFISTDKAVAPVSVMGLSKRLAEIALQDLNGRGRTLFSAVRFGNVLDSSGSVVPLFREQIAKGGPVTVTHPDMKRYFMTIPEAVSLVLQASGLAKGGEIFVLDMGEPVKIVELAEEMITLSGLRPYVDIPIEFTGVRPGERFFEELDVSENSAYKTGHARIFISKINGVSPDATLGLLGLCGKFTEGRAALEDVFTAVRKLDGVRGAEP